ncbi:MAG: hypothetical protein M1819_006070 [Sarea resinae]|nr:MAG: hypothetical protein M1819_006070 [Sarea resinae]
MRHNLLIWAKHGRSNSEDYRVGGLVSIFGPEKDNGPSHMDAVRGCEKTKQKPLPLRPLSNRASDLFDYSTWGKSACELETTEIALELNGTITDFDDVILPPYSAADCSARSTYLRTGHLAQSHQRSFHSDPVELPGSLLQVNQGHPPEESSPTTEELPPFPSPLISTSSPSSSKDDPHNHPHSCYPGCSITYVPMPPMPPDNGDPSAQPMSSDSEWPQGNSWWALNVEADAQVYANESQQMARVYERRISSLETQNRWLEFRARTANTQLQEMREESRQSYESLQRAHKIELELIAEEKNKEILRIQEQYDIRSQEIIESLGESPDSESARRRNIDFSERLYQKDKNTEERIELNREAGFGLEDIMEEDELSVESVEETAEETPKEAIGYEGKVVSEGEVVIRADRGVRDITPLENINPVPTDERLRRPRSCGAMITRSAVEILPRFIDSYDSQNQKLAICATEIEGLHEFIGLQEGDLFHLNSSSYAKDNEIRQLKDRLGELESRRPILRIYTEHSDLMVDTRGTPKDELTASPIADADSPTASRRRRLFSKIKEPLSKLAGKLSPSLGSPSPVARGSPWSFRSSNSLQVPSPVTPSKPSPVTPSKLSPVTPSRSSPVTPSKPSPATPNIPVDDLLTKIEGLEIQVQLNLEETKDLKKENEKLRTKLAANDRERVELNEVIEGLNRKIDTMDNMNDSFTSPVSTDFATGLGIAHLDDVFGPDTIQPGSTPPSLTINDPSGLESTPHSLTIDDIPEGIVVRDPPAVNADSLRRRRTLQPSSTNSPSRVRLDRHHSIGFFAQNLRLVARGPHPQRRSSLQPPRSPATPSDNRSPRPLLLVQQATSSAAQPSPSPTRSPPPIPFNSHSHSPTPSRSHSLNPAPAAGPSPSPSPGPSPSPSPSHSPSRSSLQDSSPSSAQARGDTSGIDGDSQRIRTPTQMAPHSENTGPSDVGQSRGLLGSPGSGTAIIPNRPSEAVEDDRGFGVDGVCDLDYGSYTFGSFDWGDGNNRTDCNCLICFGHGPADRDGDAEEMSVVSENDITCDPHGMAEPEAGTHNEAFGDREADEGYYFMNGNGNATEETVASANNCNGLEIYFSTDSGYGGSGRYESSFIESGSSTAEFGSSTEELLITKPEDNAGGCNYQHYQIDCAGDNVVEDDTADSDGEESSITVDGPYIITNYGRSSIPGVENGSVNERPMVHYSFAIDGAADTDYEYDGDSEAWVAEYYTNYVRTGRAVNNPFKANEESSPDDDTGNTVTKHLSTRSSRTITDHHLIKQSVPCEDQANAAEECLGSDHNTMAGSKGSGKGTSATDERLTPFYTSDTDHDGDDEASSISRTPSPAGVPLPPPPPSSATSSPCAAHDLSPFSIRNISPFSERAQPANPANSANASPTRPPRATHAPSSFTHHREYDSNPPELLARTRLPRAEKAKIFQQVLFENAKVSIKDVHRRRGVCFPRALPREEEEQLQQEDKEKKGAAEFLNTLLPEEPLRGLRGRSGSGGAVGPPPRGFF